MQPAGRLFLLHSCAEFCHFARPSLLGEPLARQPFCTPGQSWSKAVASMRITIERSNLLKSLNHVHRVVERRNTIPILSNVLLKADGANLDMKATDLDLEITE